MRQLRVALGGLLLAAGCSDGGAALPDAAERGRKVYMANCTACHNPDPTKPGGVGPEIAGSPRDLIEARVLRAEYPPDHEPKRTTRAMVALPHLEGEIDALAAFLAQAPRN